MDWKQLLFSFQGRIGRQQWWLSVIGIYVVIIVLVMAFSAVLPETSSAQEIDLSSSPMALPIAVVGGVLYLIMVWAGLALSAKRWHDRGKSAWWILIGFVPIIGGIWALVENGFLKGTDGPNQYGEDPLRG